MTKPELSSVIADPEILSRSLGAIDASIFDRTEEIRERFEIDLFLMAEKCESPLEILLGANLLGICNGYDYVQFVDAWGADTQPDWSTIFGAQVPVGPYRADFLFKTRFRDRYRLVVVEVDGHDYHERTKAQARRDKQRDRWFLQNGVECLRFTGSEIFADPAKYAEEVSDFLSTQATDLLREAGITVAHNRGPIA